MNEIKTKIYCPRCGNPTVKRGMNPCACNDPECCGINWEEDYCSKCKDTITLCLGEKAGYNIKSGVKN
ncbi:MAG TPA: hypothetical protein ENH85_00430 [Candidatus Scalindua sp.]|nr:hypothetical protein [Candidatus Scalindua sp.]